MTQPNHPQQPDYFGGPEWPSESHAQGGFDQFGQPVTAHPYQAPDPYSNHSGPSGEDHRRPHVDFGRAVKLFFKNYAVFNGRASRSEYWWIFPVVDERYRLGENPDPSTGGSSSSRSWSR